ncbi:MAG: Beta-galactosidase C-terminal domain, partial [Oscillospiraceae bacterium]|nr:Beta-galactosidase C-terminal domain [Oscillospiraceae bacterium]
SLCGLVTASAEKVVVKEEFAARYDIMLHAYMFTLSGLPVLYSGDEIAETNDYGYHNEPFKCEDSRWLHRGDMDWKAAENRTKRGTVENTVFASLRKLEKLRARHSVFDGSADTWVVETGDPAVLGIGRWKDGQKLIALFNFSKSLKTVKIGERGEFTDLMTNKKRGAMSVTLRPGDFAWLLG